MPTIEFDTEIEIEVYCATCRAGLCNETESTTGYNRGVRQFRVNACPNCIEEKDYKIRELEREIEDLKYELEQMTN